MKPNVLITSGPTREYIDPVRFISNASSGKMGGALAQAALARGFKVILISGPAETRYPGGAKIVNVTSASEMLRAAKKYFRSADIVIGAAAVSDYRPASFNKNKIKKASSSLKLKLIKNPDILKILGSNKNGRVLVGFALETKNLLSSAKKKLKEKNLDLIAANSYKSIGKDKTTACLINKKGKAECLRNVNKVTLAKRIIDESVRIFENNKAGKACR